MRRATFKLVQGNPEMPARRAVTGPVEVVRRANDDPDLITLEAVAADGSAIGSLTLPYECMDMQDMEWLRERAERLPATTLTLIR